MVSSGKVKDAIIMAAGRGNRLLPLTLDCPKCLLEVGGAPILIHQLRCCEICGVERVQIITGHGQAAVHEVCEQSFSGKLEFRHNADFDTTNSLYSLGCAELEPHGEGVMLMNSDVLFHPDLMRNLLDDSRPNVLLADFCDDMGEEEMKICTGKDGKIEAISKAIAPSEGQAENLGVLKVSNEVLAAMFELARPPKPAEGLCWVPDAIHHLRLRFDFYALGIGELPWIEIDYRHDLDRACSEIWPLISGALKH